MASVRMTRQLRYDIMANAEKAYDAAHIAPKPLRAFLDYAKQAILESKPQRLLQSWVDQAKEAGMYDNKRLSADCPKEVDVHKIVLSPDENGYDLTLEWPTKWSLPTFSHRNSRYDWDTIRFDIDTLDLKFQATLKEHHESLRAAIEQYKEDARKYRADIKELLEKVTTLKQLLEVWPGAESLIPSEKIQAMHTKVSRKERAQQIKQDISFDPTAANQTVLAAKMLGG